ncbi:MAG: phosphatidate cytidylyltransferase [Microbacteriaceae bacterium]
MSDDEHDDRKHTPGEALTEFQEQLHASQLELQAQFKHARDQFDATNELIKKRSGRDLLSAILVGLLLGGGMLGSLIFLKVLFVPFTAVLVGLAAGELASALRIAGREVPRIPTVGAAVLLMPAMYFLDGSGRWFALVAAIALVSLWRVAQALPRERRVSARNLGLDLLVGAFVQLYVSLLAGFALVLTAQPGGQWWTVAFLVVVVVADTGAYASGLIFGKHRMAPRISPKKTWEGFGAAAAFALIAGVLLAVLMLDQPWWVGLILGGALALSAVLGDLIESLIKRDIGVKDMSSRLPGHGGVLDRLDSILPSAVVAYALYQLFV